MSHAEEMKKEHKHPVPSNKDATDGDKPPLPDTRRSHRGESREGEGKECDE